MPRNVALLVTIKKFNVQMLPKHTKNLLVTFTQVNPNESKQFVLFVFNRELRGGGSAAPPERHCAFWGQAILSSILYSDK